MAKAEWGTKRTCPHCGAKFYDMMKSPIICPKCERTVEPEAAPRPRRSGGAKAPVPQPVAVVPVVAAVEEAEEVEETAEAAEAEEPETLEDASDLGEDEDDVAEVLENVDETPEDEP